MLFEPLKPSFPLIPVDCVDPGQSGRLVLARFGAGEGGPVVVRWVHLAARVSHAAVAHSPEEPTLAESTEVTAHVGGRLTAASQRHAVRRRRGPLPHAKLILDQRVKRANVGKQRITVKIR